MSGLKRFFVDKIDTEVVLFGDEYNHAVNVLRVKKGEEVLLCNNTVFEYVAVVKEIGKKQVELIVKEKLINDKESSKKVLLIAGYLKGDKSELVVQKATELGVYEIVMFDSAYSSAYMNNNKLERLNKVAVESAKQCGRSIAPKVIYKDNLKDAINCADGFSNKLFACEFADKNDCDFSKLNSDTAILVGSEGGFTEEEAILAKENGFTTVSLGKRILRAETAAIVLSGIVMHRLGELE